MIALRSLSTRSLTTPTFLSQEGLNHNNNVRLGRLVFSSLRFEAEGVFLCVWPRAGIFVFGGGDICMRRFTREDIHTCSLRFSHSTRHVESQQRGTLARLGFASFQH